MDDIHHGVDNDDHEHALGLADVNSIHELETTLHNTLIVQVENLKIGANFEISSNDGSSNLKDENIESGFCKSFPVVKEEITPESDPEGNPFKRSQPLPTQPKLISALKGSREKEGIPPKKLTVSWAPDVYDPLPTSVSHYPKKKSQQVVKHGKKHGKGKQKGKNVRGGGSGPKDKKHHRKTGGRSDRCLDTFAYSERVISSTKSYNSLDILHFNDDINLNSPDSNCSSNFLGQTGGAMHCVC